MRRFLGAMLVLSSTASTAQQGSTREGAGYAGFGEVQLEEWRDTHPELAKAEEDATAPPDPVETPVATIEIRGMVVSVSPSSVVIQDLSGENYRASFPPTVRVLRGNAQVSMASLEQGQAVRARLEYGDGVFEAAELNILVPPGETPR